MPDRARIDEFLRAFQKLRDEISGLRDQTAFTPEFVAWHGNLLETTRDCFGEGSAELSELSSIQFEGSPEVIASMPTLTENARHAAGFDRLQYGKQLERVSALLDEYCVILKLTRDG